MYRKLIEPPILTIAYVDINGHPVILRIEGDKEISTSEYVESVAKWTKDLEDRLCTQ
jgi:hypothetical protein